MNQQTHTPTPWEVVFENHRYIVIGDGSVRAICDDERDAAFIVRAVNRDHLFEELLAAAKEAYRVFSWDVIGRGTQPTMQNAYKKLAQAISKAEGKL